VSVELTVTRTEGKGLLQEDPSFQILFCVSHTSSSERCLAVTCSNDKVTVKQA
jgi:hypothetical protein